MTSGPGYSLDPSALVLVPLSSLAAVAAVVLLVRALGRRHGWSPGTTAAHTWSGATAAVAVVSLLWIAWGTRTPEDFGWTAYAPLSSGQGAMAWSNQDPLSPGIATLVWLPCVMALLWSVLHVLRSGTGHPAPLLGVPAALAVPALWLVSAPLQVTSLSIGVLGLLTWVGLAAWLVGQALVATGRSWSGDVVVWVGIALVAADAWPGYLGLVSPVVVGALVLLQRRHAAGPRSAPAVS